MKSMSKYLDICDKYQKNVDFALVYIEEAHPNGYWTLGQNIDNPSTLEDRVEIAKYIDIGDRNIRFLIDSIDNKISTNFGALPERLYIILDNLVKYQGGLGPYWHNVDEVEEWIKTNNYH